MVRLRAAAAAAFVAAATAAAAAAPDPPPACIFSNDSIPLLYAAEDEFATDNAPCWREFAACLEENTTSHCTRECMTSGAALQSACDTYPDAATWCTISGRSDASVGGVVPFSIRTAACVPAPACGQDQLPALQAAWRERLCGEALASSTACAAVQVACAWDNGGGQLWVIVGSVAGSFGAVLAGCGLLYCRRRHKELQEELEEGFYEEGDDGELGDGVHARVLGYAPDERESDSAALVVGGNDNDDGAQWGEDPTPYTYAQPPTR